jgi:hypothetical protein
MEIFSQLYPFEFWLKIALSLFAYAVTVCAPVIVPLVIAMRNRLPRKMLFVVLVPALLYGGLLFLMMILWAPIEYFGIHFAPTLKENGLPYGAPVLGALETFDRYKYLLFPAFTALGSVLLSRYLLRRWARIVEALNVGRAGAARKNPG